MDANPTLSSEEGDAGVSASAGKPPGGGWPFIAVAVAVFVGVAGGTVWWLRPTSPRIATKVAPPDERPAPPRSQQELKADALEAFALIEERHHNERDMVLRATTLGSEADERHAAAAALKAALAEARGLTADLSDCFDPERFLEQCEAKGLKRPEFITAEGWVTAMQPGFLAPMEKKLVLLASSAAILSCRLAPGTLDADVTVHAAGPTGTLRLLVRMTKQGNTWRIFDVSSVEVGLAVSDIVAELFAWMDQHGTKPLDGLAALMAAVQRGNYEAAAAMADLPASQSPPVMRWLGWVFRASLAIKAFKPEEAEAALAEADRIRPNSPAAAAMRSRLECDEGKFDKALDHAEQYLAAVGSVDLACFLKGGALLGLERGQEAAFYFRKGLEDDANSDFCIAGLLQAEPDCPRKELASRLGAMEMPKAFRAVARLLAKERNADALDALSEGFALVGDDPAWQAFCRGEALALRGEFAKAEPLLKQAVDGAELQDLATLDAYYEAAKLRIGMRPERPATGPATRRAQ